VESLRRLPSGNTILGANANGGVTLQELDSQDAPVAGHKVTFTNYSQLRLLRRTPQGTFLIGVGAQLAEVNWDKQTLWEMDIPDGNWVFQGLRLPDKTIAVTSGYGAAILIIDNGQEGTDDHRRQGTARCRDHRPELLRWIPNPAQWSLRGHQLGRPWQRKWRQGPPAP
jgi:hypothetical protein